MSSHGIYSKVSEPGAAPSPGVPPRPRTWLVGENNPYYPYRIGCSGARLCTFLGLTEDEYLERFERRNLLSQEKWSVPLARRAAAFLVSQISDGDRLVLLGAQVTQAFRYEFELLKIWEARDQLPGREIHYRVLIAPHPSSMSRIWNDPAMPARLRAALAELEGRAAA